VKIDVTLNAELLMKIQNTTKYEAANRSKSSSVSNF